LVTCLELLFSNDNEGMGYKISNRIAILFAKEDIDIMMLKKVKDAYDARSRYVHGDIVEINPSQKAELQILVEEVMLLVCNLVIKGLNKQDIIRLLDSSMISSAARRELNKALIPTYFSKMSFALYKDFPKLRKSLLEHVLSNSYRENFQKPYQEDALYSEVSWDF